MVVFVAVAVVNIIVRPWGHLKVNISSMVVIVVMVLVTTLSPLPPGRASFGRAFEIARDSC